MGRQHVEKCSHAMPVRGTAFSPPVAGSGSSDVWAVGYSGSGHALTEHWDGTSWSVVGTPDTRGSSANLVQSVSVVSASDVWAAGYTTGPAGEQPLIEHWDGTSWSVIPGPAISGDRRLCWCLCVSGNDIWFVGFPQVDPGNSPEQALIEHWDGTALTTVPAPLMRGY